TGRRPPGQRLISHVSSPRFHRPRTSPPMSAALSCPAATSYPDTRLFIDGAWTAGSTGRDEAVLNPATGTAIGRVAHASTADLDRALAAADRAFRSWRRVPAFDRAK